MNKEKNILNKVFELILDFFLLLGKIILLIVIYILVFFRGLFKVLTNPKIFINLALCILLIGVYYASEVEQKPLELAPVMYVNEEDELLAPVTDNALKNEVVNKVEKNTNINTVNTKTILEYDSKTDIVEYIDENQGKLVNATKLTIDGNVFYLKDEEIMNDVVERLIKLILVDDKAYETYQLTGEIEGFKYDGKFIKKIILDNNINYGQEMVIEDKVIKSSEELWYQLFHQTDETSQKQYYIVKKDETFEDVKEETGLTDFSFYINNPQYYGIPLVQEGDLILNDKIDSILNITVYLDGTREEVIKYDTVKKENDDLAKGKRKTITKGKNGVKEISYSQKIVNGKVVEETKNSQNTIKPPVSKVIEIGTKEEEISNGIFSTVDESTSSKEEGDTTSSSESNIGGYIWPMDSRTLSRGIGLGHNGLDITGTYGSNIYAAKAGTVATSGYSAYGGGNEVTIDHGGGEFTVYSHMKQTPNVSVGEEVSQGQVIGYMGASGNVTGPHLHFEIRVNCSGGAFSGTVVDPLSYLP